MIFQFIIANSEESIIFISKILSVKFK